MKLSLPLSAIGAVACVALTFTAKIVKAEESKTPVTESKKSEFPPGNPDFKKDLNKALEDAKQSGKPVLAVFSAIWCGPCHHLKDVVFPSETIKAYHDKFSWVYLDIDEPANETLVTQYKVNAVPHLQFFSSQGEPLTDLPGAPEAPELAKIFDIVLKENETKTAAVASEKK